MPGTQRQFGGQTPPLHYQEREAAFFDLEYAWKNDDVEFWKALAREYAGQGGSVLELACGTLRLLLPVAEDVSAKPGGGAICMHGLDNSPWMLKQARKKLAQASADVQARVTLHEGDMRAFDLKERFNLIYVPFNSFLILLETSDQLAVFDAVRQHLAPGGVFGLDVFVPDVNRLTTPVGSPEWTLEIDQTDPQTGRRMQRHMAREVDPRRQQLLITWRIDEYENRVLKDSWLSDLRMTYIFPRELEHLVARAGYEFVHYWGDYDRRDFWTMKEPGKQLAVVKPK